jgi:hypothetical protein
MVRAFRAFERRLEARQLDDSTDTLFLKQMGLLSTPGTDKRSVPRRLEQPWRDVLATIQEQAHLPPLSAEPAEVIAEWIGKGFLVGQGRRSTDVLVLRVPLESLERLGLVRTSRRRSLGGGARESKTVGYQVELLPPSEAEIVRKDLRRAARLLTRLSLNLPCFGYWMPEPYWDVFGSVQEQLMDGPTLTADNLERAAATQRVRLLERSGLEDDLTLILDCMVRDELVEAEKKESIRAHLLPEMRRRIQSRTPELIAAAIGFRTARQRWSPFESTEMPYRQLMCDVVQSVLSSTSRNGEWPKRFHSLVAKELADAVSAKLNAAGGEADGSAAQQLLEQSSAWESPDSALETVINEFRSIVPLEHEFRVPERDEIFANLDDGMDMQGAS